MGFQPAILAASLAAVMGLGAGSLSASPPAPKSSAIQLIQFRDRDDRDFGRDFRRPDRGAFDRIWRAGERVPDFFLDRVVNDWQERGLERPPGGHQWLRTDRQFLLVRFSDRRIARIITFD